MGSLVGIIIMVIIVVVVIVLVKREPKAYTPPRRAPSKPSATVTETRHTEISAPPAYPPPPRPVPNGAGVTSIAPVTPATKPLVPATRPAKPTAPRPSANKPAVQPRVLGELKTFAPFLPSSLLTSVVLVN